MMSAEIPFVRLYPKLCRHVSYIRYQDAGSFDIYMRGANFPPFSREGRIFGHGVFQNALTSAYGGEQLTIH